MDRKRIGTVAIIQRVAAAALAAAAVIIAVSWWQMPYLHNDWYGEDLNVILHLITFAACPVLCALTFLFAEKNRKLCVIGDLVILALAIVSTFLNSGFVPYVGTFVIGLLAVLYLLIMILVSRSEKYDRCSTEDLIKKFKTARAAAVISAAAAAFSVVFPKGKEIFSQHMGDDGPGVIEYYYRYTDFGIFLMFMIPVLLFVLVVFVTRAGLLYEKIRKRNESDNQ